MPHVEGALKTPFTLIIRKLQSQRAQHERGSFLNNMYKQLGNGIYGAVAMGIGYKVKKDIQSGTSTRMNPSRLSNAILSSWTTSYIRAVVGENLHSIAKIGGNVVSVTTDGYITDVPDLEDRLVGDGNRIFASFQGLRTVLTKDPKSPGLEVKHRGVGIIAWKTRGQLSEHSGLIAMTGFQRGGIPLEVLGEMFRGAFESDIKKIEGIHFTLRSCDSIYNKGGHATALYRDQLYSLCYDDKRLIVDNKRIPESSTWFDSNPHKDVESALEIRKLARITSTQPYSRITNVKSRNKYRNDTELAMRVFLKGLLSDPPMFNLVNNFADYQEIIDFIEKYVKTSEFPTKRYRKNDLASLKRRVLSPRLVPRLEATIAFVAYIKTR